MYLYIKNRDRASPVAGFLCFFSVLFVSGPRRQSGGAGESASAACVFVRGRAWSWSVRFRTLVSRWSALRLVLWFCGSVGGSGVACRGCPHGSPGCVRSSLVPSGRGILLRLVWVLGGADLCWLAGLARVGRLAAAGERLVGSVWPWWAWSPLLSDIARCMMNLGAGLAVFQLCARQRSFLL